MSSNPRRTANDGQTLRPPEDLHLHRRPSTTTPRPSMSASIREMTPTTPQSEKVDPIIAGGEPALPRPRPKGETSGSGQEKPSQPDTTESRNTANPAGDPERDTPNDPRPYCLLEIVSWSDANGEERPLVDVIAIQDQDESREEAWIYDFEKVAKRNARSTGLPRSTGQGSVKSGSDGGGSRPRDGGKAGQGGAAMADLGTRVGPWREGVVVAPLGDITDAAAATTTLSPVFREAGEGQSAPERPLPDTASIRPPSIAPRRGSMMPIENSRPATSNAGAPPAAEDDTTVGRAINWLHHPKMLPAAIPGARIMAFSYPSYQTYANTTLTLADFLSRVSLELFAQIRRQRTAEDNEQVPVVFVACGFGGLVLQSAVTQPETGLSAFGQPAGAVFIDAPYPALAGAVSGPSGAKKKPPPAIYGSVRMRRISEFVFDGQEGPVDCAMLWNDFDVERTKSGHDIPVVWLYNRSKTKQKPPDNELRGVVFRGLPTDRHQETDRYWAPEDPNYREVLSHLQRFILFKAASSERLESLLEDLIEVRFPLDAVDENGQSALHIAASVPNATAVAILANHADAGVLSRDSRGQTPLHKVIMRAAEVRPSDEASRGPFRDVIQRILRRTLKVDELDDSNRSAWDYASGLGFSWIRELRAHREMIQGPSITAVSSELETLKPPTDEAQLESVISFEAIVAEFFLEKRESERQEFINYETPTVFDLIYAARKGPERILGLSRPRGFKGRSRCRWIHLPANNEQWVHDLFIKLRIKDSSMASKRHEGSRPFGRWMYPQAKRYKHAHEKRQSRKKSTLKKIAGSALSPPSGEDSEASAYLPEQMSKQATSSRQTPLVPAVAALSDTDMTPQGTPTGSGRTRSPAVPKAGNIITDMDAVVIFMPVLGFETDAQRRAMSSVIRFIDKGSIPQHMPKRRALPQLSDTDLLTGYLKHDRPVHCRRTLDQFSYYMLDSTERRDRDQVSYKWGRKNSRLPKGERPVLMVDQLWLWALHNGTVISAFPNTWDPKHNKEFDLRTVVEMELAQNKTRRPIQSAEELVHLIIKMSVDFFNRTGPGGFKFQECFQSSINDIIEEQAKLLKGFRRLTRVLNNDVDVGTRSKMVEELFRLTAETKLLTEIMDIQDELNIVRSVLMQQRDALDKLLKILLRPEEERERSDLSERSDRLSGAAKADGGGGDARKVQFSGKQPGNRGESGDSGDEAARRERGGVPVLSQSVTVLRNKALVVANMGIVDDNIKVVGEMMTYARNVQTELNNLLDLKQKQANAWEARFSREGTEQTQRQGNIMFVFTIVTIIFLPLSFIATLMTIPVNEYPRYSQGETEPGWPLHTAYAWIFGVGTAILVPLMALAVGVNHIAKFTETKFGRSRGQRHSSASHGHNNNNGGNSSSESSEYDSDGPIPDNDAISEGRGSQASMRTLRSRDGTQSGPDDTDDPHDEIDPDYALLLGRWKFHVKIPLLRRLWRYTASVTLSDDFSMESFRVYDYPFHHWVEQPLGRLAIRLGCGGLWIWAVGAEEGSYLSELPKRDWGAWWKEVFKGWGDGDSGREKNARGHGHETEGGRSRHSMPGKTWPLGMGMDGGPRLQRQYVAQGSLEGESDGEDESEALSPLSPLSPISPLPPMPSDPRLLPSSRSLPELASPEAVPEEQGIERQPSYVAGQGARARASRRRYIDVVTTDETGRRRFGMRMGVGTWGRRREGDGGSL